MILSLRAAHRTLLIQSACTQIKNHLLFFTLLSNGILEPISSFQYCVNFVFSDKAVFL